MPIKVWNTGLIYLIGDNCLVFYTFAKIFKGTVSPILLPMIDPIALKSVVEKEIESFGGFLVELTVSPSNQITLHADTHQGISLAELSLISKAIEANFDREVEDYELEVSSPGMSNPIRVLPQYMRFIGRELRILKNDGNVIIARLQNADADKITLEKTERVNKPTGKGKIDQTVKIEIPFVEIKEAKLEFKF